MSQFLYTQASTQRTHRGDCTGGLKNSRTFNASVLTWFGYCCYWGRVEDVIKTVEAGTAPDLEGTETPYKFNHVTLVIAGAQRIRPIYGGDSSNLPHFDTLKYFVKCSAPVDLPDIVALSHGTMHVPRIELCRFLLQSGANPNHQDRFGAVPLLNAFMKNSISAIDLLMEFGADVEIADADGVTPRNFQLKCGPEVTATPMPYCSTACQRSHWPTHKPNCHKCTTVTLKPFYDARHTQLFPTAKFARDVMDIPAPDTPAAHHCGARTPRNLQKGLIIKVQVPYDVFANAPTAVENPNGDLMVVRWCDGPAAYDRILKVVRTRGVGGAKAYFAAELKTKEGLVVDVDEVLSEQPF
ncbi:hypothetical protein CPB85DRAFT_1377775 [Mucidula mucida]|nr:hypothetical protein CPB85DRAFT_1377775 [Mucidula mucida]